MSKVSWEYRISRRAKLKAVASRRAKSNLRCAELLVGSEEGAEKAER